MASLKSCLKETFSLSDSHFVTSGVDLYVRLSPEVFEFLRQQNYRIELVPLPSGNVWIRIYNGVLESFPAECWEKGK